MHKSSMLTAHTTFIEIWVGSRKKFCQLLSAIPVHSTCRKVSRDKRLRVM